MADNQNQALVQVETRKDVPTGNGELVGRQFVARTAHRYDEALRGDIDPEHPDGSPSDDHVGRRGD